MLPKDASTLTQLTKSVIPGQSTWPPKLQLFRMMNGIHKYLGCSLTKSIAVDCCVILRGNSGLVHTHAVSFEKQGLAPLFLDIIPSTHVKSSKIFSSTWKHKNKLLSAVKCILSQLAVIYWTVKLWWLIRSINRISFRFQWANNNSVFMYSKAKSPVSYINTGAFCNIHNCTNRIVIQVALI